MKLFVLLTFDINGGQPKDYSGVTISLEQINLQRSIWREGKNSIQLPHNTYAGAWNHPSNAEAALAHVRETLGIISRSEPLSGTAFISISGEETAYQGVTFDAGNVQVM